MEIGSGSIRIHEQQLQERIFKLIGINKHEAHKRFGFLLDAFQFGAPPHGGIALGLDRLLAILAGETTIREVDCISQDLYGLLSFNQRTFRRR